MLWLAPDLRESLVPYKVRPAPDAAPERFETGTPAFEAIAGIRAAAAFLGEIGMERIAQHEAAVFGPLLDGLLGMPHVVVHGPRDTADRTPTVCFSVTDRTPDDAARALAADRVAVWSGDYYAVETMDALGLAGRGALRAGVSCYTSPGDVERLLTAVGRLAR